jgi:methyl-accepting chemotaxis protein
MALSGLTRRKALVSGSKAIKPMSWVAQLGLLLVVLTTVGLIAALSDRLIDEAARGEVSTATRAYLALAIVGFCLACGLVVFSHAYRLVTRLVGPSYRLIDAMKRVRTGDIGFRVHLRRGDMLLDVANEFNQLLDWLNSNPPCDVTMGSDVVDVDLGEEDEMVGTHSGPTVPAEDSEGRS